MDLTESIAPRSDQLNAEDLLSGPRTFTIREVRKGASPEQPVDVELVEFPGRPFKPSKTVRRILVAAWGADASAYAGRRLTLYRDATVRFGGQDVGGIRVSHMSDLAKPLTIALTVSRGKRAPHVVKPLTDAPAPAAPKPDRASNEQRNQIAAALKDQGITDKDTSLAYVSQVVGRDVASTAELTRAEADAVLASFTEKPAAEPASDDGWPTPAPIPGSDQ